jgi:aminopeptidase YwaD
MPRPKESLRLALALCLSGIVLLGLAIQLAPGPLPDERAALHPGRVLADIRFLSDPRCEGRAVGLAGTERAMRHIEAAYREAGLMPVSRDGYRLPFTVKIGQGLGPESALRVGGEVARLNSDWVPLNISESGQHEGPVVFAGHGIRAPELAYDDYEAVDVKGAWVVVLDHEPREADAKSPFRRPDAFRHRELRTKAIVARERGAKGLLLVADAEAHPETRTRPAPLPEFDDRDPVAPAGLLVAQVSRAYANWLLARTGSTLDHLEKSISTRLAPSSRPAGTRIAGRIDLLQRTETAYNLVGMLPGGDLSRAGETVLIGAHYDHLGYGGVNSLAPGQRLPHVGADDNASGTAGVLALARDLAADTRRDRAIAFACFSGEEMGLLGSSHLAKNSPPLLGKVVAMLNMDMVGRMRGNALTVQGVDTSPEWDPMVRRHGSAQRLAITTASGGYGPSDHTSFLAQGIPVLFFFTGAHSDYHRPTDTWDKINARGEVRVLRTVAGIARELAVAPHNLVFQAPKAPPPAKSGGGGKRGYGAYFGSVPDFTEHRGGVKITGVNAGSPAAALGLKASDMIVRFGGVTIDNLYDLTYALRIHRSGDTVEVEYVRAGTKLVGKTTLKERR